MVRILSAILALCLLTSCSQPEDRSVKRIIASCKGNETSVANFTLQCIKNANPISDEEPEDWIYLCKKMAVDIFCAKITVTVKQHKDKYSYWKDVEIIDQPDQGVIP